MIAEILWNTMLAGAGMGIVWIGSRRLETASQRVADFHGIPEAVKGAVITAVASSFPELSSVVLATLLHGEFELGVASIIGSAMFNILVIPALSAMIGGTLDANRTLVYKEALFYLLSTVTLLLTFSLAVVYFPDRGDAPGGTITRGLAMIPLGLYALYLLIQYHDIKEREPRQENSGRARIAREWMILLLCMILVAAGVELLVRSALNFGRILNTPSFLWGLIVVAAGTSLPDLFISIQAARSGRSITSLSNVLGSNTFDLLVAVPIGVLLGGATAIDFSRAAPAMGCLLAATIVLFICMRRRMNLGRIEGSLLLALYLLFLAWMVLENFGVISLLRMN